MSTKKVTLTKDQTLQLIKEVHQRPCLWNPYDEKYSRRHPVARAWKDISHVMDNLPVVFLRVKWKCLRDAYKKELNKYPDNYTGTWRFFKPLNFLVFRSTNDTEPCESENEASEKETEDNSNECANMPVIKYEPTLRWNEGSVPEDKKPNDEAFDVLFLQSLTPYFKQLDPIRKLVIRSKMQDMLFNEISAQKSGTGPQYD